uniref:Uncharacterized protein n=2 Tax=Anguilla anguilla TaxID=7936 RepID=A0A0E9TFZ4_ANGAN
MSNPMSWSTEPKQLCQCPNAYELHTHTHTVHFIRYTCSTAP